MECLEIPVLTLICFPFQPKQLNISYYKTIDKAFRNIIRGFTKNDQTPFGKLVNLPLSNHFTQPIIIYAVRHSLSTTYS